jgi:hypothetical protein
MWRPPAEAVTAQRPLPHAGADPAPAPGAERSKFALLVGISRYDRGRPGDWWNLNTKGDLELLAGVLIKKFQFKPENIKVLSDEDVVIDGRKIPAAKPTSKVILDTFRSFLTARVKEGDVAYFHFSGHGQQVPDDEKNGPNPSVGDELDGYDETIIPADYVSQKDGSKNIRDDEIGKLLDELSQKKPANVTISLDSCFSGTATRGGVQRGGEWKGDPVDPKKVRGADEDAADILTSRQNSRGGDLKQNYVFLSAAGPRQIAKEVTHDKQGYGAFSYALVKAMENSGNKTTYRDLFQKVTDVITQTQRDQTPQIEGAHLDKILMEDGALPAQRFVGVRFGAGGGPFLAAGKLQGLTNGSKFNLCAEEAKECSDKERIAAGTIIKVNPTTAALKLEGEVERDKLKTAKRAFEVFHSYEDVLRVAVRPEGRGSLPKLEAVLADVGLAGTVPFEDPSWNVLVRASDEIDSKENKVAAGFRGLVLQRQDGSVIKAIPENAEDTTDQLREALLAEARWLTVKSLDENTDPELDVVKLRMVPVSVEQDDATGDVLTVTDVKEGFTQRGGKVEMRPCVKDPQTQRCKPNTGDAIRLEIQNTGSRDVYVTILNLQSDGKIGPAFPRDNKDNLIKAGTMYRIPYTFRMTEPYGQESFRLIVTADQTDFTPLVTPDLLLRSTRGDFDTERGQRAAASPLGRMLKIAQSGKRSEIGSTPPSWATTTVTYFIVPAEVKK